MAVEPGADSWVADACGAEIAPCPKPKLGAAIDAAGALVVDVLASPPNLKPLSEGWVVP